MEPKDRFGRMINPRLFAKLQGCGRDLSLIEYRESATKPNLFYYGVEGVVVFFADMRGTRGVPIWKDSRPLFYWRFTDAVPLEGRAAHVYIEWRRLLASAIEVRVSHYSPDLWMVEEWTRRLEKNLDTMGVRFMVEDFCCSLQAGRRGWICQDESDENTGALLEALELATEQETGFVHPQLAGHTVVHPSFGQGSVTEHNGKYVTIQFAERRAQFRLPDAVTKGFLQLTDPVVLSQYAELERLMAEREKLESKLKLAPRS